LYYLVGVITKLENSLTKEVSNLKTENANLQLKIRALEVAQARRTKEDDKLQQHLHIEHTESVRVDHEDEDDDENEEAPKIPSSSTKRKGKKRIRIEEKLKGLPVIKETVLIPREVEEAPEQWEEIGEVVSEEVLVVPTTLGRHQIRNKKYRNKQDRTSAPIMAKAPIRFSSSYVSASLAIYIVLNKYLDHSTLYRLEKKFDRMGLEMTRQSQSDAVERMSEWLRPLYELMDKRAKSSGYLQIDETFIKYINGNKPGGGQGYFWAIHAPGQSIVLKWINNRRHENVETLVAGFAGILQSDGYAAYGNYVEHHPEITLTACWAHTFRKFRDALEHEPSHAKGMMKLISKLYKLEEQWDQDDVSPSKRKLLRQAESIPITRQIKDKLDAYAIDMTIPKNDFRIALNYTVNQWPALLECLKHGHTRLDTNLLESKFRPTKIGAKNWMFIGHPDAGQKSAIIYSLLQTCTIHNINPYDYLTDVLAKLIPHDGRPPEAILENLLPQNWNR
jgi:transposase